MVEVAQERRLPIRVTLSIAVLILLLYGGACGSQDSSVPDTPDDVLHEATLDQCPQEDKYWSEALIQAKRNKTFSELQSKARALTESCGGNWQPFWLLAELSTSLEEHQEASRAAKKGLDAARSAQDPVGVARLCNTTGWLEIRNDALDEAAALFREGIDAAREAGRYGQEGHNLNSLAQVLWAQGDLGAVSELYTQAIAAFEQIGWNRMARRVRYNQTALLLELGDVYGARIELERLHHDAVKDSDNHLLERIPVTLGNLYFLDGEYEVALDWFDQIPEDAAEQQAFADLDRGRIALRQGRLEDAVISLDRCAAKQEYHSLSMLAEVVLARVDLSMGRAGQAIERSEKIVRAADRLGYEEPSWYGRWVLGLALASQDRSEDAIRRLRESVKILDGQGSELDTESEGFRFLRERSEPYADLAFALSSGGNPASERLDELLVTLEKTHSRALRHALHEEIGPSSVTQVAPLQSRIHDRELILNYLIGEDNGVLLAIGRDKVQVHRIPGARDLQEPLKRYRNALRRPLFNADARNDPKGDLERSLKHGIEIRKALLDPVADLLASAERIYVVPDTEIALLPFVALPWSDDPDDGDWQFLGERFEVAVLPMAGGAPKWDSPRTPMLLAGDPLPDAAGEYPALPTSGMELDLVSRSWKNGEQSRLDRSDLTAGKMMEQPLGSFKTLHFATHAVASTADPNGCAVYLSRGDRLGLKQILNLDLQASPLVVLSACQTGEGELIPGEGVVGLGWAFLRAGAQGVVASLWSVEDTASAELMIAFHRHMSQGQDPVTALSLAQREMAAARFHPAYWAPFIIVLRPETGS